MLCLFFQIEAERETVTKPENTNKFPKLEENHEKFAKAVARSYLLVLGRGFQLIVTSILTKKHSKDHCGGVLHTPPGAYGPPATV